MSNQGDKHCLRLLQAKVGRVGLPSFGNVFGFGFGFGFGFVALGFVSAIFVLTHDNDAKEEGNTDEPDSERDCVWFAPLDVTHV
jgi:hypothetical protein